MACDIEVDPILGLCVSVPRPAVRLPALRVPSHRCQHLQEQSHHPATRGSGGRPRGQPGTGLGQEQSLS